MQAPHSISVSIIIPTYNRASLIGETISSILAQTYPHWELIIVDDGSDDATAAVVADFADERIRYLKLEHSGIGGKIKNAGLHMASGELIAFNDSDDLWHPSKLEKQVIALQENPEAGFCITGGYNFSTAGVAAEYFYKEASGAYYGPLFEKIFNSTIACFTQALLFRKDCLTTIRSFSETGDFSDIDFIARLAYHFNGILLYEPLLFRRLHAGNYIQNDTWQESYRQGAALLSTYRKQGMLGRKQASEASFRLYINYGEKSLLYKKKALAFSCFARAWWQKPFHPAALKKMIKTIIH